MSAKTVFSRNVNHVFRKTILEPIAQAIQQTQVEPQPDIYIQLAEFTKKIDHLFDLFSRGNFSQIVLVLTRDKYNSLAVELLHLAKNDPTYEQIRTTIAKSLEGLYQGVLQHILLINTQYELIKVSKKASILDDMCKLREYLEHMKETLCILPDSEVSIVTASVKPEYLQYIQLYGYPEGGVFEADKLAQILKSSQT
jgi:hypothetical protein